MARVRRDHRVLPGFGGITGILLLAPCGSQNARMFMVIGQAAAAASRRNQRRGEVTRGGVRGGGAVCSPSVPCPRRRPWPRPAWPRPAAAARSTHSRGRRLLPAIAVRTLACADRTRERQEPRARNPSFKFYQGRARFERAVASPSWVSAEHRAAIARAPRHVCSRAAVSGFFWCSLRARSFLRHLRRAALPRASRFLDNLRSTLRLIITRCCFRLRGGAAETEKGDCSHSAALGSKHKKHSRRGGRILLLLFGRAVVFVLRGSRRSQARSGDVLVPL